MNQRSLLPFVLLAGGALVALMAAGGGSPSIAGEGDLATEGTAAGLDWTERLVGGLEPGQAAPMLVVFHGRGGDPDRMADKFLGLGVPARVIAPTGPDRVGGNPAWWELRSTTKDQAQLVADMGAAAATIGSFLEAMRGIKPTIGRPVLAGHSQGGMAALVAQQRDPSSVAHAVAGSAWLPPELAVHRNTRTTLIHGDQDDVVPYDRTVEFAQALGVPLAAVPGAGHSLSGALEDALVDAARSAVSHA
jgi:phospholipase/carboxylesterase